MLPVMVFNTAGEVCNAYGDGLVATGEVCNACR
jgi:hypothetical protein